MSPWLPPFCALNPAKKLNWGREKAGCPKRHLTHPAPLRNFLFTEKGRFSPTHMRNTRPPLVGRDPQGHASGLPARSPADSGPTHFGSGSREEKANPTDQSRAKQQSPGKIKSEVPTITTLRFSTKNIY